MFLPLKSPQSVSIASPLPLSQPKATTIFHLGYYNSFLTFLCDLFFSSEMPVNSLKHKPDLQRISMAFYIKSRCTAMKDPSICLFWPLLFQLWNRNLHSGQLPGMFFLLAVYPAGSFAAFGSQSKCHLHQEMFPKQPMHSNFLSQVTPYHMILLPP